MTPKDGLLHRIFRRPPTNLGSIRESADGIWSPGLWDDELKRFMSDYYTTSSAVEEQATKAHIAEQRRREAAQASVMSADQVTSMESFTLSCAGQPAVCSSSAL